MAGKFFEDLADPDTLPRVKLKKPPVVKPPRVQLTGKKGCKNCPLRECWGTISSRQMESAGNLKSGDILVLGASPSDQDDLDGAPFSNKAGELFKKLIPGRYKKRIIYQNLVRCHEPAHEDKINVAPSPQAAYACSKYLAYDLEDNNIKAILGVGQAPLNFFWPGAQIWQVYGLKFPVIVNQKVYWYYPVMDPNSILISERHRTSKFGDPEWDAKWPVMKGDVERFFAEVDDWPAPKIQPFDKASVTMCFTEEDARAAMAKLARPYGFDVETNGLDPMVYGARFLTCAFADANQAVAWPIEHREGTNNWGLALMYEYLHAVRWIAHNAGFEWVWVSAHYKGNKPLPLHFECTQARARLLHQREMALSLASLTRIYLGVDVKESYQLDVKRLDDYPVKEVLGYNGLDAIACIRLHNRISPMRLKEDINYERLMQAIPLTAGMQIMGLPIDLDANVALRTEWEGKIAKAEKKLRGLYEVKMYERNEGHPLDLNSGKQIAECLIKYGKIRLPKTDKGNYKTDMATLEAVAAEHPLIMGLKPYREATKQVSTYIDPIAQVPILYPDGLLHPSYTTTLVATLRLSSADPNIQNFPKRRHREVRRQIIAGEGYILLSIDFGQLEVRVVAMASGDSTLTNSIITGEDMHSKWLNILLKEYPDYLNVLAEATNEKDEAKIRKGGRDTIKSDFVFLSLFGGTARAAAKRTKIPEPIMERLSEQFWATYPRVRAWHKEMRATYKRTGSVRCLTGLVRHDELPGNEIINTPIQHVGAALVGDARNELALLAREKNDILLHPRIDIHDDLVFRLPDDDKIIWKYWKQITKVMVKVRHDWQTVPLMVEGKIGYDWAEFEELGKHVGDYVK